MSQSKSVMNIDVEARRKSPTQTTVEVRDFKLTVDEPEEMGGANEGPNPSNTCWRHRRGVSM